MTSDEALSELIWLPKLRALALAAIHDKYVKEPIDDEDMLAVMLAWRAVKISVS